MWHGQMRKEKKFGLFALFQEKRSGKIYKVLVIDQPLATSFANNFILKTVSVQNIFRIVTSCPSVRQLLVGFFLIERLSDWNNFSSRGISLISVPEVSPFIFYSTWVTILSKLGNLFYLEKWGKQRKSVDWRRRERDQFVS